MRAQAQWLVLQHPRRAGARVFSGFGQRLRTLLGPALRAGSRKQSGASANG